MAQKIDHQTALVIKDMLWRGRAQQEISAITGASQSTISRVKLGQAHSEIMWPDGSTGPMPARAAVPAEVDWSADAKRLLSFPEEMQHRILETVNARRTEAGLPLIPQQSERYLNYLQMDPGDAAFEALHLEEARRSEDSRLAEVMREFDQIVQDEATQVRAARIGSIIEATRQPADASEIRTNSGGDLTYECLDWSLIADKAADNPIVLEAASGGPAMMEAACIMFWQLRRAPSLWTAPSVHEEIRRLAKKLSGFPALMKRLEEKYAQ